MSKRSSKPVEYYAGIFDVFKETDNLDLWIEKGFPELMWGLGYDMDCQESYNEYISHSPLKVKEPKNEREERRNVLYYLEHAPREIVGNFLFSQWRYHTHWAMYGYTEYDVDFLRRIIVILEEKYKSAGTEYKNIDEYLAAYSLPKFKILGEDPGCRYYIKESTNDEGDTGIPMVITEILHPHTFSICDADTALDLMDRF